MFNSLQRALGVAVFVLFASGCPRPLTTQVNVPEGPNTVLLNGVRIPVSWSDGDTFQMKGGEYQGKGARLSGFNTLEDYGPVHRWGSWTPLELYAIARAPESFLSSRSWTCTSPGKTDKYNRLLVDCPGVAEALIGEGLAMVFAVEGAPDAKLVALQQAAQRDGKGMWKKGVPPVVVSSLHSAAEGRAYNRSVDTATGSSSARNHEETYETCQEVCEGPPAQQSCMRYVPYELRYKNKPDCLR